MRIIEIHGCKHCKKVLLFLDIDQNGDYVVKIIAWHSNKEGDRLIQKAKIDYNKTENPMLMHKMFITDFSEMSANEFANSFNF